MADTPPVLPPDPAAPKPPYWDPFAPTPEQIAAGKGGLSDLDPVPPPGYTEDIVKNAPRALGRGAVQLLTSVPTIADLAGDASVWAGEKAAEHGYFSPEKLKTVKKAHETVKSYLTPYSYEPMMKTIQEEGFPSVGIPATGEWYKAQTLPGKLAGAPLELLPSMLAGGGGITAKVLRALFGGVIGEGAGQATEAAGFENAAPWVKAGGTLLGAAYGPAVARNAITPHPQTPQHKDAVDLLKEHGVTKGDLTPGAFTGSPKLLQREANLAPTGQLEAADKNAYMVALTSKSGLPQATQFTEKVANEAKAAFGKKQAQVEGTMMPGPVFADMNKAADGVRRDALKQLHHSGVKGPEMQVIDDVISQMRGGPGAMGMPGVRYQALRNDIQRKINDPENAPARESLSRLRQTLDDHMSKQFPAGELSKHQNEYANFKLLEGGSQKMDAHRQITPKDMKDVIHDTKGWGSGAYSEGRGLSDVTQAGHRVLGNRPAGTKEVGPWAQAASTGAGAAFGIHQGQTSGEMILATLLGRQLAPILQSTGRSAANKAYFNPVNQWYLKNQGWMPGPGSDVNKAMAARLLHGPVPATLQGPSE